MKLSEIRGERVFDVLADIIDPIASIAQDKEAAELFKPKPVPEGMESWSFFLERVRKSLPSLLKTHKEEFITIMTVLNDVDREQYVSEMTLPKLLSDIIEIITDRELSSFFG